jgi:hypothetical protein
MVKTIVLLLLAALLPAFAVLISLRLLWCAAFSPTRAWQIAIALDDFANVAANGTLGQTISYRAATAMRQGKRWGCVLCGWLDEVDPGHCTRALNDPKQDLK